MGLDGSVAVGRRCSGQPVLFCDLLEHQTDLCIIVVCRVLLSALADNLFRGHLDLGDYVLVRFSFRALSVAIDGDQLYRAGIGRSDWFGSAKNRWPGTEGLEMAPHASDFVIDDVQPIFCVVQRSRMGFRDVLFARLDRAGGMLYRRSALLPANALRRSDLHSVSRWSLRLSSPVLDPSCCRKRNQGIVPREL